MERRHELLGHSLVNLVAMPPLVCACVRACVRLWGWTFSFVQAGQSVQPGKATAFVGVSQNGTCGRVEFAT